MKTRDLARQIGTLAGIIGGIVLNSVPVFGGGFDPGDSGVGAVSDQTFTYITPADSTFIIWSLIFLWTAIFAVHQALPSQRENALYRKMGWWPALNGIAGGLWTLAFINFQFMVAWLLMLVIFGSLLMTSLRIGLDAKTPTGRDYWLAFVPFNINFGWITVATIVNTTQILQYVVGWNGAPLSPELWAALLVIVAAVIGVWQVRLKNIPFGLVVTWALVGVAAGQANIMLVMVAAGIAAVAVLVAVGIKFVTERGQIGSPQMGNSVQR